MVVNSISFNSYFNYSFLIQMHKKKAMNKVIIGFIILSIHTPENPRM